MAFKLHTIDLGVTFLTIKFISCFKADGKTPLFNESNVTNRLNINQYVSLVKQEKCG